MIHLISVFGQEWNIKKLPDFYEHYKNLGVSNFIFILNNYNDIPLDKEDIEYYHWNEEFNERKRIDLEYELVSSRCDPDEWVIYADPDELQEPTDIYEDCTKNRDWLGGILYDTPTNGFIKKFGPGIITSDFSLRCGAWDRKICACKAIYKMDVGHHMLEGQKYNPNLPSNVVIRHLKWDEYILEKIDIERELKDPQLKYWKEELQRAKEMIESGGENYGEA